MGATGAAAGVCAGAVTCGVAVAAMSCDGVGAGTTGAGVGAAGTVIAVVDDAGEVSGDGVGAGCCTVCIEDGCVGMQPLIPKKMAMSKKR